MEEKREKFKGMLYPFIYTRTKYHDYRIVTSESLVGLPYSVVNIFEEIAHVMIDAENDQLVDPSWALVKEEGYTLWGISILNKVLGEKNYDKVKRPVRGFFGIISDTQISRLPYSISYFKEIYNTYVMPIWDSYNQTEEILSHIHEVSCDEFITKSSFLNSDINVELGMCRMFPYGSDCKGLIEGVFASFEDCSIATNIHKKSQCIEFGKDKLSFMNVVGASDSGIRDKQDIEVYVKKESVLINDDPLKDVTEPFEDSTCTRCGKPVFVDDVLCSECKDKKKKKERLLKYGLYGFIAVVCLVLIFKGPSIWEAILSPKHTHVIVNYEDEIETSEGRHKYNVDPFLKIRKSIFNIQDANIDQPFEIQYQSSSNIKIVKSTEEWIHIITPEGQFSKSGSITFVCEPLNNEEREGEIKLVNEEGKYISIVVHQTITNQTGSGFGVKDKEKQSENPMPSGLQKVALGDRTTGSPSSNINELENTETVTTIEGTN